MKRLLFDHPQGKRIKHKDPVLRIIPYIMKDRYDATVYFEETINLDASEALIKSLRKDGKKAMFLHVFLAAMLKTVHAYPKMNRFVKGKRVFSRHQISFSFTVKKTMALDGDETVLKIFFNDTDTLEDIITRVNQELTKSKKSDEKNQTDRLAKVFNLLPGFLLSIAIGFVNFLDNHRMIPKFLVKASPFHTTAFVTDLGSIGIPAVYHHIYNFGTTSLFLAFGTKKRLHNESKPNHISKEMTLKIAVDERIIDGYYMARAIKKMIYFIEHPELLLVKSETIIKDDEIR
ncbi:MAG: 2-oxo acid dehydrogenase subunit E2 [Candidatus Izemoplasmataceae bacterium]